MAYVCLLTDSENVASFEVSDTIPFETDKYLEFAKYVVNPYEKTEMLRMLSQLSLSDYYMIFCLMDGDLWTPPVHRSNSTISNATISNATVCENLIQIQEYINNMIIDNLIIDTIEEEPEISEPD